MIVTTISLANCGLSVKVTGVVQFLFLLESSNEMCVNSAGNYGFMKAQLWTFSSAFSHSANVQFC